METKDPALTKTPIGTHDTIADIITDNTAGTHDNIHHNNEERKGTRALQETVVGANLIDAVESLDNDANANITDRGVQGHAMNEKVIHEEHLHHEEPLHNAVTDRDLAAHTSVSNGTDTFDNNIVDTEHVNDGDNPARQPDRRDQQGSAFDENINEDTVGSEAPKSEGINTMNRYASVDNAQSRILNPDEKD